MGINYVTVSKAAGDWIDWNWLTALPRLNDATFVAHARLESPVTLKVDGRRSQCVIVKGNGIGASSYLDP